MSTLFLIGNGFDLNCGMKTKYSHVFAEYVKQNQEADSYNVRRFKKNILRNLENWGDFEMAMAKYAQELNSEEEFLECVRDFTAYMEKYLRKQNEYIKDILKDELITKAVMEEFNKSLKEFCDGISHNVDVEMRNREATRIWNFSAISFNYTDVFDVFFEKVYKNTPYEKKVTHIHGILGDGPVLGVDSPEQIKTKYTLSRKGIRGFVKPVFNDVFDIQRVNEAKEKIEKASTICVFGMSLGDSDMSWRMEIINWLRKDKAHHLFIYRHNISKATFSTIPEKLDIEDDEKMKLLSDWGVEEQESIYDQIHIPCGKNIFNIQVIVEEELRIKDEIRKKELSKKIEKGKEFIEKHSQTIMVS